MLKHLNPLGVIFKSCERFRFLVKSYKHSYDSESPRRSASVSSIGLGSFEKEVLEESRPVLVLCMDRGSEFQEQIEIIESIHGTYGERVKVCLLEEEFVGVFREKYSVGGTPTFLIFAGGIERGRMLGQAEPKTLEDFLLQTLSFDQGSE